MTGAIPFKGARWFKCDLHLHTPASKCFQDHSITAEQWVARAVEQGLNCVAVTDHNTGEWIDQIKAAAIGKPLTIFPGVEITCDTSKVHLLILFDKTSNSNDVNDFIIRCGIDRDMFADQVASTTLSIFEVAEKADQHRAIVIPAHIDEFNGLGPISNDNLNKFYELPYINAVQVVHKELRASVLESSRLNELKEHLNDYYNKPNPAIESVTLSEWHKPVKKAIEKKLAIVTFSDNPHEPKNSKHGLDGIGRRFTWIKMDEDPSLEGIRQAFLLHGLRIKNDFDSPLSPYKYPELWIKSITVSKSNLIDDNSSLTIDFSPQLTSLIGGRGSGKSSVLRFIRGVFNRVADISDLVEILHDHNDFYKIYDQRLKKGVLNKDTVIAIEFIRNSILHKIVASNITNGTNQSVSIQKYDVSTNTWSVESSAGYLDFFQFEQYSQKQIYEIAQEPNSLRERIDKAISGMTALKNEREIIKKSFLVKAAAIRSIRQQIVSKGRVQTEISDLDEQIKVYQQSGIASILVDRERFINNDKKISSLLDDLKSKEYLLNEVSSKMKIPDIELSNFSEDYTEELQKLFESAKGEFDKIKDSIDALRQKAKESWDSLERSINQSKWKEKFDENFSTLQATKIELEKQGIEDISNFEKLTALRSEKQSALDKILSIESTLESEIQEKNQLQSAYMEQSKTITVQRRGFVSEILQDDKLKVSINPFRNKSDFENKLRTILQRQEGFQNDIDLLVEKCFGGNVEQKILEIREIFHKIKRGDDVNEVSGYFVNLVKGMSDSQLDEIDLLLPEDEIDVKYKPSGSSTWKPLSTASAGQKTTSILTFILSYGDIPLILDQPEDDLDNRLVYELIVTRLTQSKQHRQIIVVTHNANIPVNGDAEYILSMDSDSKKLKVFCAGTVDLQVVKKEICDVMEGSKQAFDMRSQRYKSIES